MADTGGLKKSCKVIYFGNNALCGFLLVISVTVVVYPTVSTRTGKVQDPNSSYPTFISRPALGVPL